jgi:acyl carrier protein
MDDRTMSTSTMSEAKNVVSEEAVLERLAVILREVIGEAWADDVAIGPDTSFNRDLELESIEFVSLSERLQTEYGRKVDFAGWLADMELGDIINLRVGQVVDFICKCLSSNATA